jgi:exopolysaccharide biosynthesis polyprenyl glycosylphosphotransferase
MGLPMRTWTDGKQANSVLPISKIAPRGRRHPVSAFIGTSYLIADIAAILISGIVVFCLHFVGWNNLLNAHWRFIAHSQISNGLIGFLLLYTGLIVLALHALGLYSGKSVRVRSASQDALSVCKATVGSGLLLTCFIYLSGLKTVSRFAVGFTGLLSTFVLIGYRSLRRASVQRQLEEGRGTRSVLIIGAGNVGRALARHLEENSSLGYEVKGFLDNREAHGDRRILGKIEDLYQVARADFIDEIFITIPSERETVKRVALEARQNRIDVRLVPELYDGLAWQAPLEYVAGFPVLDLHREPISPLGILLKRFLDILISATSLLVLSPLLLASALAIKFDSTGPVLYRSRRVGKKGSKFLCYKFRTMVNDAEKLKDKIAHLNQRQGLIFKIGNDPRVTRVGRTMRKYSIDELPQLWNVLKGEMSLVGPRPPVIGEYQHYSLPHLRRLDVMPGITGLWQVKARRDPSFDKYLDLDLEYIENWSMKLDLKILLETIPVVFKGTGE